MPFLFILCMLSSCQSTAMMIRDEIKSQSVFTLNEVIMDSLDTYEGLDKELRQMQMSIAQKAGITLRDNGQDSGDSYLVDVYYRQVEVFKRFRPIQLTTIILTVTDGAGSIYAKIYINRQGDSSYAHTALLLKQTRQAWFKLARSL